MSEPRKIDFQPLLHFFEYLPKSGDAELTILKSHLLIEELLNKLIEKGVQNPKYLNTARLSFSQKISLARALSPKTLADDSWLWGTIKKLNDTRNKLAHGLSTASISGDLNRLVSLVEDHDEKIKTFPASEKFGKIHIACFAIYTKLSVYVNMDFTHLMVRNTLLSGGSAG